MKKESNTTALSHVMYDTRLKARSAISQDGCALQYVRKDIITKAMCESAVKKNALALQYVPSKMMSADLIYKAVEYYVPDFTNERILITNCIPKRFLSKKLCMKIFRKDYRCFIHFPDAYKTRELCYAVMNASEFRLNQDIIRSIPFDIRNERSFIHYILSNSDDDYVAEKLLLLDDGRLFDESNIKFLIREHSEKLTMKTSAKKLFTICAERQLPCLNLPVLNKTSVHTDIVNSENCTLTVHNLTDIDDTVLKKFYYVTDIHLKHQLLLDNYDVESTIDIEECVANAIKSKVEELLSNVSRQKITDNLTFYGFNDILLVGGDVSHDKDITMCFYQILREMWSGTLICILGNHELWDGYPFGTENPRTVDEIVDNYRHDITFLYPLSPYGCFSNTVFLQNDVYVYYKNSKNYIIREKEILDIDDSKLSETLFDSSIIVLGGIGFSGFNAKYNASSGLYRSTITTREQDMIQTERFRKVYEKINRCAGDRKVIVFTHMPASDWINGQYNPNWIYVNGHTHQHRFEISEDKCVFSDNQIGYEPVTWSLKYFSLNTQYDLFERYDDGIYEISREAYIEFNRGKGIRMSSFKRPGIVYMLKRDSIYMFLLKTKTGLYGLCGGVIHKLTYNINYYYENMVVYAQRIRKYLKPYQTQLNQISKEVQLFGGTGDIHGCIVDISFYNHVYLNPLDSKITPYYAYDTNERLVYKNIYTLLKCNEPHMLSVFDKLSKNGKISLLCNGQDGNVLSNPESIDESVVIDNSTEIYAMSRVMKTLQYLLNYNVIRTWNDNIIANDSDIVTIEQMNEYSESLDTMDDVD